jgi:hypothetical protein
MWKKARFPRDQNAAVALVLASPPENCPSAIAKLKPEKSNLPQNNPANWQRKDNKNETP